MQAAWSMRGARPRWLELALLACPILLLAIGLTTIELARGGAPDSSDQALVAAEIAIEELDVGADAQHRLHAEDHGDGREQGKGEAADQLQGGLSRPPT